MPSNTYEFNRVLESIERYGDIAAYKRIGRIRKWLSQTSNVDSSPLPCRSFRRNMLGHVRRQRPATCSGERTMRFSPRWPPVLSDSTKAASAVPGRPFSTSNWYQLLLRLCYPGDSSITLLTLSASSQTNSHLRRNLSKGDLARRDAAAHGNCGGLACRFT